MPDMSEYEPKLGTATIEVVPDFTKMADGFAIFARVFTELGAQLSETAERIRDALPPPDLED